VGLCVAATLAAVPARVLDAEGADFGPEGERSEKVHREGPGESARVRGCPDVREASFEPVEPFEKRLASDGDRSLCHFQGVGVDGGGCPRSIFGAGHVRRPRIPEFTGPFSANFTIFRRFIFSKDPRHLHHLFSKPDIESSRGTALPSQRWGRHGGEAGEGRAGEHRT